MTFSVFSKVFLSYRADGSDDTLKRIPSQGGFETGLPDQQASSAKPTKQPRLLDGWIDR